MALRVEVEVERETAGEWTREHGERTYVNLTLRDTVRDALEGEVRERAYGGDPYAEGAVLRARAFRDGELGGAPVAVQYGAVDKNGVRFAEEMTANQ